MKVKTIEIVTQNVRGLRDDAKCKKLLYHFKKQDHDIILLQETHSTVSDIDKWNREWGGSIIYAHGTNQSRGVMILFSNRNTVTIENTVTDPEGRYIITEIYIQGINLTLCNLYAPNTDDPNFFIEVRKLIEQTESTDRVLAGDFNLVIDVEKDRYNSKYNHIKCLQVLREMIDTGYSDLWRTNNIDRIEYSWFRGKGKQRVAARLDYFIISDEMRTRIDNIVYKPGLFSDHSQVICKIKTNTPKRGPGLWKMNNKFLKNPEYSIGMQEVIKRAASKYSECNPAIKWEMIKTEIIQYSQLYARERANYRKDARKHVP